MLYESANIFENALLIFASCPCNTLAVLLMTFFFFLITSMIPALS